MAAILRPFHSITVITFDVEHSVSNCRTERNVRGNNVPAQVGQSCSTAPRASGLQPYLMIIEVDQMYATSKWATLMRSDLSQELISKYCDSRHFNQSPSFYDFCYNVPVTLNRNKEYSLAYILLRCIVLRNLLKKNIDNETRRFREAI